MRTVRHNQTNRKLELFCSSVIKLNQGVYKNPLCRLFNPIIIIKLPLYQILIVGLPISPHILLPFLVLVELLAFFFKMIPTFNTGLYVHWMRLTLEILRFASLEGFFICCTILCYQSGNQIKPQSDILQTYTMIFVSVGVLIEYLAFAGGMFYILYKKIRQVVSKKDRNSSEDFIFYREKSAKKPSREREGLKRVEIHQSTKNLIHLGRKSSNESEDCPLRLNIGLNFKNQDFSSGQEQKLRQLEHSEKNGQNEFGKKRRKREDSEHKEIDVINLEEFEQKFESQKNNREEVFEGDLRQRKDLPSKRGGHNKQKSMKKTKRKTFLEQRRGILKNSKTVKKRREDTSRIKREKQTHQSMAFKDLLSSAQAEKNSKNPRRLFYL